jgi:hypothetical protein
VMPKIKACDDPEAEGAFQRLSLLRFRMTRYLQMCCASIRQCAVCHAALHTVPPTSRVAFIF